MKKIKSTIVNVQLSSINDEKTGEVKPMTKITYTLDREDTENLLGPALLDCYKLGNYMEKLNRFTKKTNENFKVVEIELKEKPTKNGCKYVIESINGQTL